MAQWQALDDCLMLLEVLRCAPYVIGGSAQDLQQHDAIVKRLPCPCMMDNDEHRP